MAEVKLLDITVNKENLEEGDHEVVGHIRPEWKKADIVIKV